MKNKTVMQELIETFNKDGVSFADFFFENQLKYLSIEKKQIEEAFDIGFDRGHDCGSNHDWHEGGNQGYEYYTQNFEI